MAIFKSSVFSEVRGSIGGTTYARNKSGLYARNRSKPVNPNTANQSRVRSQFSMTAAGFSALTASQVNAWNQFAQGYPAVNKVGDTYTPSGKQVFHLCNVNLLSVAQASIVVPPYAIPVVPGIDISAAVLTVTEVAGLVTVMTVTGIISDNPDAIIVIQATPNMQAARQSYRNRMRQMGPGDVSGTIQTIATAWNAYFGHPTVTAGQIINFRVAAVDPVSGVSSAWMYLSHTLA